MHKNNENPSGSVSAAYRPLIGFVAALSAAGPQVAAAALCQPGTFSATGTDVSGCTPAPKGSFVSIAGATAATPAPLGQFVGVAGATAAIPAPLGSYVPRTGASAPTLAPPGTFVSVTGATAPTLAPPGTFVATSGATSALLAMPGNYVPTPGASAQTPASPGYYVPTAGASAQTPAPAGYYLPVAGAIAPTPLILATAGHFAPAGSGAQIAAPAGFYTYADGASKPVPAGLVAAPMNAAILATDAGWANMSALLGRHDDSPVRGSVYHQAARVSQAGKSDGGDTDTRATAISLAADVFSRGSASAGVSLNASHGSISASDDGDGKANGFQLGVYKRFDFGRGDASVQLVGGQFNFDTHRQNVSQGLINGATTANSQSATASGHVAVTALHAAMHMPFSDASRYGLVGRLSIARYHLGGFDEAGTGALADPNAALTVDSRNVVAMPLTLGLRYRISAVDSPRAATVMVGYRYDAGGTKSIDVVPQGATSVRASVPIALTGASGFVVEVDSPDYALSKTVSLEASVQASTGSRYSYLQGTLTLKKAF